MAIQVQGNSGVIQEIDATYRATRTGMRPLDMGALGHYRIARRFTPAATTLAGNLWAFRWTDATRFTVITSIRLKGLQIAAPTAAIEDQFSITIARAYTASDTTGSAVISPGAAMQKMRTSMGSSLAEVREANVAAGLSGGTKTLDGNPILANSVWVLAALPTGAGQPGLIMEHAPDMSRGEHPIVLAQNEGFVISNGNAFGAASGIILDLELAWAEVAAF